MEEARASIDGGGEPTYLGVRSTTTTQRRGEDGREEIEGRRNVCRTDRGEIIISCKTKVAYHTLSDKSTKF